MAASEGKYDRQILQAIASGERLTQRSLAREMGVAVGLANLLIRRLVGKGHVRIANMGARHVKYLMTPAGWDALAKATRASLENTVHLYTQTREHIRDSLASISEQCAESEKRIVFYGAGDVAEIAYVSLQNTDLSLVGVIDDRRTGRFFHVEISTPDALTADTIAGVPYSHVVVTSLHSADAIRQQLASRDVPPEKVFCL
jgi:DNA-binding MarR family transcriptional regulator